MGRARGTRPSGCFSICSPLRPEPAHHYARASLFSSQLQRSSVLGPAPQRSHSLDVGHPRPPGVPPPAHAVVFSPPARLPDRCFAVCKTYLRVIKCLHHIHRLDDGPPPSLRSQSTKLSLTLRPAFLDAAFVEEASVISKRWCSSATALLRRHYFTVLDSVFLALSEEAMPRDLHLCSLRLATKFARRQLKRLSNATLDEATRRIQEHQSLLPPTTAAHAPPAAAEPAAPLTPVPAAPAAGPAALLTPVPVAPAAGPAALFTPVSVASPFVSPSLQNDTFSCLVLGDSNMSTFYHPDCFVYGAPNGRLSHLCAWMRSSSFPPSNFTKIFLCLSTLDRRNRYSTLSTTTKSLLGRCHTCFPQATLFVILIRPGPDFTNDQRSTFSEFFVFLRTKHPSRSIILPAPSCFSYTNDRWDSATRTAIFDLITRHLNSTSRI